MSLGSKNRLPSRHEPYKIKPEEVNNCHADFMKEKTKKKTDKSCNNIKISWHVDKNLREVQTIRLKKKKIRYT